ncbi:response regulator [Brevundimonas terrae]|uniref:Response regulator n=1 Tax=Brevundimonas terrae TaxID=363631 RepID=A0ABN0Y8A2_9CAUL|nr:response regulator [Brevundimonas terrae]NIJ25296.1 DNA-binding response OmpR family regulator [Brevundimonas terrae]
MRVLVVEDDPVIADGLRIGLRERGYVVELLHTVEEALAALETTPFDAAILDLGLPDGDGLDVLRFIRSKALDTSVIVLTARDHTVQRIEGLDTGADDYIVKPFDLDELAARLRAVRRRNLGLYENFVTHGAVKVDPVSRQVWQENEIMLLSRREFDILYALMERPSQVLSRSQLEERLYSWQEDIGSNAVEVHIHNLRAKLGSTFIRTVRGVGYTLQ